MLKRRLRCVVRPGLAVVVWIGIGGVVVGVIVGIATVALPLHLLVVCVVGVVGIIVAGTPLSYACRERAGGHR